MQGILKLDSEVSNMDSPDILHLVDLGKLTYPRELQLFSSKSSAVQMKIFSQVTSRKGK